MLLQVIGFLLVGRLVVFVLQKFPFIKIPFIGRLFEEGKFLEQLFGCSLCLGVWVFTILSYLLQIDFIKDTFGTDMIIVNSLITGMIASFVVYIFEIGWNTRFGVIEVH